MGDRKRGVTDNRQEKDGAQTNRNTTKYQRRDKNSAKTRTGTRETQEGGGERDEQTEEELNKESTSWFSTLMGSLLLLFFLLLHFSFTHLTLISVIYTLHLTNHHKVQMTLKGKNRPSDTFITVSNLFYSEGQNWIFINCVWINK